MVALLNHHESSTRIGQKHHTSEKSLVEQIEIRKKNGAVHTPANLASFVASKVVSYFMQTLPKSGDFLHTLRIVDPACGDGELLAAIWRSLPETLRRVNAPESVLCGIDIDEKATEDTRRRIASLSLTDSVPGHFNILRTNALCPFNDSRTQGWTTIERKFSAQNGFHMLIANPPWGADIATYQNCIANGNFTLYKGQFDTSDLFVELALSIVKQGGCFAFIVPDSLFDRERTELRKRLAEETQILYIGRFGEKIFKGINRACAVVICRNSKPTTESTVDCMQLTPQLRKRILSGAIDFQEAERTLSHVVLGGGGP